MSASVGPEEIPRKVLTGISVSAIRMVRVSGISSEVQHAGLLADLQTAPPRGQDLAGIEPRRRIEQQLQRTDRLERILGEQLGHQLILFHADAVLARNRSAHTDAPFENLFAGGARLLE